MSLFPYQAPQQTLDHYVLKLGDQDHPFLLENDGILTIASYVDGSSRQTNWDGLALQDRREFTHCANDNRLLSKNMQRMMRFVERIERDCVISLENDCARVLFKWADANNNQKLNTAEIKNALEPAKIFADLVVAESLTPKEIEKIKTTVQKSEGKIFSDDMIAQYDSDKTGDLTYDEIMSQITTPQSLFIRDILQNIGRVFPAFGLAAQAMPKAD